MTSQSSDHDLNASVRLAFKLLTDAISVLDDVGEDLAAAKVAMAVDQLLLRYPGMDSGVLADS